MEFNETVNDRIRACRIHKKITQQEMADKLGIKRSTYAYMESKGEPTREMISKIAKILEISDFYLWSGSNEKIQPRLHEDPYPYKVNYFTATRREQKLIEMFRMLSKEDKDEKFKEIELLYEELRKNTQEEQ